MPGLISILLLAAALSFSAAAAAGHTDPQDVYALRILYESLRSPSLPGWSSHGGDPCGELWHGVECSGRNVIAVRLSGLKLRGSLGYALNKFTSLLVLDVSNNHIGETLPFQFPARVVQLNLGNNVFIGSIPYSIKRLMSLTNLNLSRNFLSGGLPDVFEKLSNLQTLDASNNNFTGELPSSFGYLSSLSTLHVQQNELNGTLDILRDLPLKDLNIENNGFSGSVPRKFFSLPIFRGSGNHFNVSADLNHGPNGALPLKSPGAHTSSSATGIDRGSSSLTGGKLAGIICGGILAIFICVLLLLTLLVRTKSLKLHDTDSLKPTESKTVSHEGGPIKDVNHGSTSQLSFASPVRPLTIERFKPPVDKSSMSPLVSSSATYSYPELHASTGSFCKNMLIGEGLLGRVYKGEFPDGKTMAIKKLESLSRKDDELEKIISNISKLHHGNLVELVGFCLESGQCFLVYPYFSKGTLHDLLHCSEKQITWNQRMRVLLGAARALEYLHEVLVPAMVHRNFKSTNILLDEEFNPYVSDSGVADFIPLATQRQISSQMLGSFGYSAPEYALSAIYTMKSDVYSFGVVMLELLTGREPLDSTKPRSREQSLVAWATPKLKDIDLLASIVDPNLKGIYPAKALSKVADLISQCIQVEPEARPVMSQVVQSLVALMKRSGMSKRTVSRELPSQNSFGNDDPLSLERSFERQNLSSEV